MGSTTYDKCGEISYRIKNLDDQDRIKNLDYQEKIFKRDARVQIVLDKRNKNSFTVIQMSGSCVTSMAKKVLSLRHIFKNLMHR